MPALISFVRRGLPAVLGWSALAGAPAPAFQAAVREGHMVFVPPSGWVETPVIPNEPMAYDLALRLPGQRLEVRYAIRFLAPPLADYVRARKDKTVPVVNPNTLYKSLFQVVTLNVTDGQGGAASEYPPLAVHREFRADWGATAFGSSGPAFGQRYKYCMVAGLHKQAAADAYYFYLFDDKAAFQRFMVSPAYMAVFHSLRFL